MINRTRRESRGSHVFSNYAEREVTQRYHFERGRASGEKPGAFVLASGVEVQGRDLVGRAFRPGQDVMVSWTSIGDYPSCSDGIRYVDYDAIEPVGAWALENRYRAKFPNGREQRGFLRKTES